MIARETLSRDAFQILGCADLYASKNGSRVIFFSDLTRMFTAAGTSWAELGIDWEGALKELQDGPFPSLFLTISERAYLFICSPATRMLFAGPGRRGGSHRRRAPARTPRHRRRAHHRLAALHAADDRHRPHPPRRL